ncbi:MAG: class I SAM-dependent methyltransferase, partial [Psittacicella sp.]
MSNQDMIQEILNYADVKINGTRPWDIQVHDERIYEKILQSGSLGFGEAYMEGYWSSESLDVLIYKLLNANIEEKLSTSQKIKVGFKVAISKVKEKVNRQSVKEAAKDVSSHYDIGNDLFSKMLDKRMAYTCAYWKNSDNLDDAQEAKLDLVC